MSNFLEKKLRDPETKTAMGPCLVTFAVPLFIPGFTLTLVAFQDETGFSKYSALHVTGMVFLAWASLLLVVGIVMKITCHSKVSPAEQPLHRMVSTHHKKHPPDKPPYGSPQIHKNEKGQTHSHSMERDQIPCASVGSNVNMVVVNETSNNEHVLVSSETVSIPDETVSKPMYSGRESDTEQPSSSSGHQSPNRHSHKHEKRSKHKKHKPKNRDSDIITSKDVETKHHRPTDDEETIIVVESGPSDRKDIVDGSEQKTNLKTKAAIRDAFAIMSCEGDGEEHTSIDHTGSDRPAQRSRLEHASIDHTGSDRPAQRSRLEHAGTPEDKSVQQRTGIAWDDPGEEKGIIRVDDSMHSVNFFPPIHQTRTQKNNFSTQVVITSDDNTDDERDSYTNSEFYDDEDNVADENSNITSHGGSTLPEVEEEGYGVDRFNNSWRETSRQDSVDISSVLSHEVESDSVSELYDETEETQKISDTKQGRISRVSSVVVTSEMSSLPDNGLQGTQKYQWANDMEVCEVDETSSELENVVTKF